jgi:hypothetical protein
MHAGPGHTLNGERESNDILQYSKTKKAEKKKNNNNKF